MIVGFPHAAPDIGGPGSFQTRITRELSRQGHEVVLAGEGRWPDVILVVGGTRRLPWLARCRRRGARVIHRIDGMNWLHRVPSAPSSRPAYRGVLGDLRNRLIQWIRDHLTDVVVYQSEFARSWWSRVYGPAPCPERVIYNGVQLSVPQRAVGGGGQPPRMVSVEGRVPSNPVVASMLGVAGALNREGVLGSVEVVGGLTDGDRDALGWIPGVELTGPVPRQQVRSILSERDILLSLDINPACPNAVLEAMAAGLPVVGYDTGALSELVGEEAGRLAPYGGDPWVLGEPDEDALRTAILDVVDEIDRLGSAGRRIVEERFGLDRMVEEYRDVMEDLVAGA